MARSVSVTKRLTGTQNEFFQTQRATHLRISSQSRVATTELSVSMRMEFLIPGVKASSDIKEKQ